MTFEPLSQDEFLALPPEKQLAYMRAVDALQRRTISARPLNPPPSTIDSLRTECEKQRGRIVDAMREGQEHFYPHTDANILALLRGEIAGFLLPPLQRLWHSATFLDVSNLPPLDGEPQTALAAVAALDALLAALGAETRPIASEPAGEATVKKHGGGKPPLETSDPFTHNLYQVILAELRKGEPVGDLLNRLRQNADIVELAKAAGRKLGAALIRSAKDWRYHAARRAADKPTNS